MKVSVCIIANNLTPRLREVLLSYQYCDEVLVGFNGQPAALHTFSLPNFAALKIHQLSWKGYGPTKNELASLAHNDWILSVDADEVADSSLQDALRQFNPANSQEIYQLRIQHYFGARPIRFGAWGKGKKYFARLYHRQYTSWDTADVHETIQLPKGHRLIRLPGFLRHYTVEDKNQFEAKNEQYAQLSASKYAQKGKKASWLKRFIAPVFTFLKQYIFQFGFLDGTAGFTIAKGNGWYTFRKYQLLHESTKQ
jgi:hypothetical protein